MRRSLIACALGALMLAALGCCATTDATLRAVDGNTRDLRLIRDEMVDLLPDAEQSKWDKRLVAFIVRAESIKAGVTNDKDFDVKKAKEQEENRVGPR